MHATSRSFAHLVGALLAVGVVLGLAHPPSVAADDSGEEGDTKETEDDVPEDATYHVVKPGETVGTLALQYGSSVKDILDWNGLTLGEAEEGMKLIVDSDEEPENQEDDEPLPVVHVISKGDTLGGIADRYNVTTDQVKRWNPNLNPRLLQLGDRIRLYVPGRNGKSVSWGKASNGKLYNGVALKSWHGLDTRNVAHAYGTERVVQMLMAAAADVQARWPDTPDLVVGHLSYKQGGPMSPHSSHQSGRDADLSFYYRGNVELPRFFPMTQSSFDAKKNWHLFKTLIDTGEVEYIFVSYYLQKLLYEYARSIGYSKQTLKKFLQYPRSKYKNVGIIRHSAGHDDHFHIRFTCGPEDRHCR